MRIFTKLIILIIGLIISFPVILWIFYPPFPKQWLLVKPGMTEKDVAIKISGSYSGPEGLEQEEARMKSCDYYYELGQYHYFSGTEYSMVITYDKNGKDGGIKRKVIGVKIATTHKPFIKFICGISDFFY